jgi:hypothetical protein
MRTYLSSNLAWTALHSTALARQIEDTHEGEPRFDIEHRSYVLAALIAAAGFLEAAVNELYKDASEGHGLTDDGYLAPLSGQAVGAMAALWDGTDEGFKLKALEKWQFLLVFAGRSRLDQGASPYQDASLVVTLRNALAHAKPEMVWADEPGRMERRLRGKFNDNRLMAGSGNPWWPDHCLGHGCADWAVSSALGLADAVCSQLGLSPNYDRMRAAGWYGHDPSAPVPDG